MINTFKIGDRVRVAGVSRDDSYSRFNGRVGEVIKVGGLYGYNVKLDEGVDEVRDFRGEELVLEVPNVDISLSERQIRILIDLVSDWPSGEVNDPDVAPVAGE